MAKFYDAVKQSMMVLHNGVPYHADRSHPNHALLLAAFNEGRLDDFVTLLKPEEGEKVFVEKDRAGNETGLVVSDEGITYQGRPLHSTLVDRIIGMRREKHDISYMTKFLERLLQNPSSRAVSETYDFLANQNLPIDEDGCFLAYKSVNSQFGSKYTNNLTLLQGRVTDDNRIINTVGEVIECVRNEVDDERGNECSKGLHVGGLRYSGPGGSYNNSGDKVIIVKVDPKDVVSVPKDYNAQKMRVCKYEVVELYNGPLPEYSTSTPYENDEFDDELDEWEDEEDEYEDEEYLDPSDLEEGDVVYFIYPNENGMEETRFIRVDRTNDDGEFLCGVLLKKDPSYDPAEKSHRNFKFDKMSEVEYY